MRGRLSRSQHKDNHEPLPTLCPGPSQAPPQGREGDRPARAYAFAHARAPTRPAGARRGLRSRANQSVPRLYAPSSARVCFPLRAAFEYNSLLAYIPFAVYSSFVAHRNALPRGGLEAPPEGGKAGGGGNVGSEDGFFTFKKTAFTLHTSPARLSGQRRSLHRLQSTVDVVLKESGISFAFK